MDEFVKNEEIKIKEIISKPFNLDSLLKSLGKIGYTFYDTEHKIGDYIIKVFRSNKLFSGGSILFNEETKEFFFLSDYKKTKSGTTYFIISNNEKIEKTLKTLISEFTGETVTAADSFLKTRAFSILKHKISPFVKERRLNIGSKSLNLLMLYAFSKLESSSLDCLPACYIKYLQDKCFRELRFVREQQRDNMDLKARYLNLESTSFPISRMIDSTIRSKKYRHMFQIYGLRLLFLLEAFYIKNINDTFRV